MFSGKKNFKLSFELQSKTVTGSFCIQAHGLIFGENIPLESFLGANIFFVNKPVNRICLSVAR